MTPIVEGGADSAPYEVDVDAPEMDGGEAEGGPVGDAVAAIVKSDSPTARRSSALGVMESARKSVASKASAIITKGASSMGLKAKREAAPAGGSKTSSIRVAVRVRPFNQREKDSGARPVMTMAVEQPPEGAEGPSLGTVKVVNPSANEGGGGGGGKEKKKKRLADGEAEQVFKYDHAYDSMGGPDSACHTQEDIFKDLGQSLLDAAWSGYNCSLLAYGQTGSGKTHSITGSDADPGLIPRFCGSLFLTMAEFRNEGIACRLSASYLEIYNEQVFDLLTTPASNIEAQTVVLKVREHPKLGPYVEGVKKMAVESYKCICDLLEMGQATRRVAETKMNATSSRSHAVLQLELVQMDVAPKADGDKAAANTSKKSIINLVDLAGSERSSAAGTTGTRLQEGSNINKSLSTLGRCINALATPAKKGAAKPVVPYRDSTLTWLLKESLGGNAVTIMLAAVSPADINYEETVNTLRYAQSAKKIQMTVKVNKDNTQTLIDELAAELEALKAGKGKSAQIEQDELLLKELTATWEDKIKETEAFQKAREDILQDHGVSIVEMARALGMNEELPTLVNLDDDVGGIESNLLYILNEGTSVLGGAAAPDGPSESNYFYVQIGETSEELLDRHAWIINTEGTCSISPAFHMGKVASKVYVNGKRCVAEQALVHRDRVIIGEHYAFRFRCPRQAAALRKEHEQKKAARPAASASRSPAAAKGAAAKGAAESKAVVMDADHARNERAVQMDKVKGLFNKGVSSVKPTPPAGGPPEGLPLLFVDAYSTYLVLGLGLLIISRSFACAGGASAGAGSGAGAGAGVDDDAAAAAARSRQLGDGGIGWDWDCGDAFAVDWRFWGLHWVAVGAGFFLLVQMVVRLIYRYLRMSSPKKAAEFLVVPLAPWSTILGAELFLAAYSVAWFGDRPDNSESALAYVFGLGVFLLVMLTCSVGLVIVVVLRATLEGFPAIGRSAACGSLWKAEEDLESGNKAMV